MNEERRRRARLRALRRYSVLVRLYPRAHWEAFGTQMQQTFVDQYRDFEDSQGRVEITFWLGVLGDAAVSLGREHLAAVHGAAGRWSLWPYRLPAVILSAAVGATLAGNVRVLVGCALAAWAQLHDGASSGSRAEIADSFRGISPCSWWSVSWREYLPPSSGPTRP